MHAKFHNLSQNTVKIVQAEVLYTHLFYNYKNHFFGQSLVPSILKILRVNGAYFCSQNKNYSSCYKLEWELIGSYFDFFQLILAYLELMVFIFTVVLITTPKINPK